MPRIKLKAPGNYTYSSSQTVRVTDVNYGGHLANNAVAGLLHQARIELLAELGVSEMDLGDGKTGLIMTDMGVTFGAEAFMLDKLTVLSEFSEVRGSTFRMCHALKRGDDLIVLAEMGFAGYDYQAHKLSRLPAAFVKTISH
jgi:acyl-CoA thioester hydrolase